MSKKKDPRLARAGVSGYNKPKRTPNHPKKSHIVVAKEGDKIKIVFHPMMSSAKNPDANLFTLKISNTDIAKLKKAL